MLVWLPSPAFATLLSFDTLRMRFCHGCSASLGMHEPFERLTAAVLCKLALSMLNLSMLSALCLRQDAQSCCA